MTVGSAQSEPESRNPILTEIVGIVEQGRDSVALRGLVDQARDELLALRSDVSNTIDGLTPDVREYCGPQIHQVEQALTLYEGGLTTVDQYFRDQRTHTLTWGGELIRRAAFQVNNGLFNLRNAALVAMGPTDIPDYNFLHQLVQKHKQGEIPREGNLHDAIDRMTVQGKTALSQLESQPASAEKDMVVDAYRKHVAACELLVRYVTEGDVNLLETGMNDLRAALIEIRDLIPQMQTRLRSAGPTRSPMANYVINLVAELVSGKAAEQVLRDAIDQLRANYEMTRRELESQSRVTTESPATLEKNARVREALALEQRAIEQFYHYFDTRDSALLSDSCNKLISAMRHLENAQA